MKIILSGLLMLLSCFIYAKENFPSDCEIVPVQEETLILKTKKPTLLLIHNESDYDLWITHPVSDPSASAGWSSRLESEHWSALVIDKKKFGITCIESKPGHEQQMACSEVIKVCKWKKIKIPPQLKGSFWAVENKIFADLKESLGNRGFKIPH